MPLNAPTGPYYNRPVTDPAGLRDFFFKGPIDSFRGMHTGGCNMRLAAGSTRFIRRAIDVTTYVAPGGRTGGEVTGDY